MKKIVPFFLVVLCLLTACNGDVDEKLFYNGEYTIHFEPVGNNTVIPEGFPTVPDITVRLGDSFKLTEEYTFYFSSAPYTYSAQGFFTKQLDSKALTFELNSTVYVDSNLLRYADKNKVVTLYADITSSCLLKGTLITMADGSKKAIENIKLNDEVLTYNFYTGEFEAKKVILIEKSNQEIGQKYIVHTNVGKTIEIAGYHTFFDPENQQYLDIGFYNFNEVTGRKILLLDGSTFVTATITSVTAEVDSLEYYCLVTEDNLNCFGNDFFTTIPTWFAYIPFEIDDNLVVNSTKMSQDLEIYDVYNYQDYPFEVSEDLFNKLGLKFTKILLEKGFATYEDFEKEMQYMPLLFNGWN